MLVEWNQISVACQGWCPVRFVSGFAVRVWVSIWVRVWFATGFVSRFVSGRCGFVWSSCLVSVWVRVWWVSGSCLVRVRFVFGSYQGSRSDSWLDSYAYKVRIRLYIYFKSWIIVEFINILYLIIYFDVYLI